MSSIKTNIILNIINTITGILFPIITFPYATRILLPNGIGTINFLQSIINYIILLTSIGIPMYAVREVAKHRDNIDIRNQTTIEILLLSLILCTLGYIVAIILNFTIPQIASISNIFWILSLSIIFTSIGINWFYQAIEDFKYITYRAIIFRILCTASLFIFVHTPSDLQAYAWITVGATVGNNFINFIHLRKYISIKNIIWRNLRIWRHLKPALHIFILNIVISLYTNLNTTMLGFIQDNSAVGYYTAGNKISNIILNIITSIGVVLLPRCSNLIETKQKEKFASITQKTYELVIAFSLPCLFGLIVFAPSIITLFCGTEFLEAVPVLQWTAPIILFIGLSNVVGLQILYPQNKENIVIWSTIGGALFNLVLNIWLMPKYSFIGAGISTFTAELVVLIIQLIVGYKYIPFKLFRPAILKYVKATFIMTISILIINTVNTSYWINLTIGSLTGCFIYIGLLYVMKDELLKEILSHIKRQVSL